MVMTFDNEGNIIKPDVFNYSEVLELLNKAKEKESLNSAGNNVVE